MSIAPIAPDATFVIFGARGDLTKRLLTPAIVNLARDKLIPTTTRIIGVSYHDIDDAVLRAELAEFVKDDACWKTVAENVQYLKGDFGDAATYKALANRIDGNAVFYLATAPSFFGPIVDSLGKAKLLDERNGFRRVVIEKPFGTDLDSARALNRQILSNAAESQFYRIDHFLGKETVQNIMVARFGNVMFEAMWNSRYIDHVEITAAEAVSVGTRGKFYDSTGALRDMVPNHLFQLLAMVAMEPPNSFDAEAVRTEKAKVIAAVRPVYPDDAVRGRYDEGEIDNKPLPGYLQTPEVSRDSRTETYVALKVAVETWRWSGVPFYLRTGKALAARDTEVVIQFRDAPIALFRDTEVEHLPSNRLVLQIQPDEGISMEFAVKRPGPVMRTAATAMDFRYADAFKVGHQTGYETLLYDVLMGDQTLFQRADQIEGGWRAVQPLLDAWGREGTPHGYAPGSSGPRAADELLARDGSTWHKLGA